MVSSAKFQNEAQLNGLETELLFCTITNRLIPKLNTYSGILLRCFLYRICTDNVILTLVPIFSRIVYKLNFRSIRCCAPIKRHKVYDDDISEKASTFDINIY